MIPCKRSVLATAVLVVISMPLSHFLYWKAQQLIVRHEMMEKLEQSNLVTIELPASSVQWYEEEKEIIVQGRLFDVKSYIEIPGTYMIAFTGLYDDAETEIEEKVKKLLNQEDKKLLVQSVWLLFFPLPDLPALSASNLLAKTSFYFYNANHFPIADLSIPAPPPKA